MCGPASVSTEMLTILVPTYIVITDILVDRAAPCSNLTLIPDQNPLSNSIIDYASDVTKDYYLRFLKNNAPYDMYFKRVNIPTNPMTPYRFQAKRVEGQNTNLNCGSAPLSNCEKMIFSGGGAQANLQMTRQIQVSATDQIVISGNTFDSFALYYCSRGNFNGGGDRSDANASNSNSYVVSPFHDYLQIGLDPNKRLKSVRMMDISGRLAFNQTMPDDLEFSDQLNLPTEQLARGLYILQLQSNDGKVETFKVVKE